MLWKKITVCTGFAALLAAAVRFHAEISDAILLAGSRCVSVIIPSLFLFSVLASLCIRTGLLEVLADPLDNFSRKWIGMDGVLLMILLFSQFVGYPVGAQLLQQLRQKNALTVHQERSMLCVCFGCGPAFLLGTVSWCMQLAPEVSLLLMASILLPNLLFAVILARRSELCRHNRNQSTLSMLSTDFTAAVESAAAAMLKICSMILVFAALMGIAKGCGLLQVLSEMLAQCFGCRPQQTESWLSAVLEISNITEFLRQGGTLPWAAALLSFGGVCVHLQNAAISGGNLAWGSFWGIRILSACASYWLCAGGLQLLPEDTVQTALASSAVYHPAPTAEGVIPVLCLMLMSVLLLRKAESCGGKIHKVKIDK